MTESAQYKSLDVFKYVAAFLVVAIHTRPGVGYVLTSLCRIAVPFFFVCSSFLFWKKKGDIGRYTKRILILYLVWSVIYLPNIIKNFTLLEYIHGLFLSNTFHASWFLMAAVISMNLVKLLSKRLPNSVLLVIGILLYCLSLLSSSYFGLVEELGISGWFIPLSDFLVPANSFVVAFIYIVIGKIITERSHIGLKASIAGSVLFLALGIAEIVFTRDLVRITDAFVFIPPFIYFFFQLLLNINPGIDKGLCLFFRNCSTFIYLFHYICIDIFFSCGMTHGTKLFLLVAAVSVAVSSAVVLLQRKVNVLKYLY